MGEDWQCEQELPDAWKQMQELGLTPDSSSNTFHITTLPGISVQSQCIDYGDLQCMGSVTCQNASEALTTHYFDFCA